MHVQSAGRRASAPYRVILVGVGKIARDQHIPAIRGSADFELGATVTPLSGIDGVRNFRTLDQALRDAPGDAVALCVPPAERAGLAMTAISAGCGVLLEKPPAASLGEGAMLAEAARHAGVTLFASWHARFAPALGPARDWLKGRPVKRVRITWREDVEKWHPGQGWIWEPGGFGVFDAGINAISMASALLEAPLLVREAELAFEPGRGQPVAARLQMASGPIPVNASFDWRAASDCWEIVFDTDRERLCLLDGGARLQINGRMADCGQADEYPALYRRFAALLSRGGSEIDLEPLRVVADAVLRARRVHRPGRAPA